MHPSEEFCFNECNQNVVWGNKCQFFLFFQNFGPHGKYARKLRLERRLEKKVKQEMEQKELTSE